MIIKNGTKLNGIPVDSTSILSVGRVVSGATIKPTSFTIHGTSNPNATAENHRKFLLNHNKAGATGAISSWHFTVDNVKIVQHLDTAKFAYHAGTTKGNQTSIGIEVCEFDNAKAQAQAFENAQILVRYLMNQLGIDKTVFHNDWTGKHCPRKVLDGVGKKGFLAGIPKTVTVNGLTSSSTTTAKATNTVSPSVSSTKVGAYTFLATDKHIGVVEVTYNGDGVNIREKADLTSKVVKVSTKGQSWKVYAIVNGLYKLGDGQFITSNGNYVKYYDNPYLDDKGKALASTATTSTVTTAKAVTKTIKVLVDNLNTYNSPNWNDKSKTIVGKGEVYTVVKELTVSGSAMYQLKSGLYITASSKYVK